MKLFQYALLAAVTSLCVSCNKDEFSLKNDFIKKSVAPNIVGEKIVFSYAMGATSGKLGTAEARASVNGAIGTGFEPYSYYTTRVDITIDGQVYKAGSDIPLRTVKDAKTDGVVSTAVMEDQIDEIYMKPSVPHGARMVDMIAATIRYAYVVPEEARGKTVSFTFSSQSSLGATASTDTDSYKVSKMDMKRLISLKNQAACYFSIENMAAYTKEEVKAQNLEDKIDFIYLFQDKMNGFDYKHTFVSPGTDPKYIALSNIVPNGCTNKTRMEKRANVRDAQLKGDIPNVYIDDIDFETLDLGSALDYALNFIKDDGAFMKTANGKYSAYVYVNSIGANEIKVSIKRYPLQ